MGTDRSAACGGMRRRTTPSSAVAGESPETGDVVISPLVLDGGTVVPWVSTDRSRERGTGVSARLGGGNRVGIEDAETG